MQFLLSGFFAFLISLAVSALGLGGGFLYIPVFTWLGFDYTLIAIPLALVLNIATTLTAQASYMKKSLTDIKAALTISVAAVIFAQIGVRLSHQVPANTLMLIFSIVVAVAALNIIFFDKNNDESSLGKTGGSSVLVLIISGIAAGLLSGLLGIAGGFIVIPALLLLGYPSKRAAATSSLVVFFSSISSLVGRLKEQELEIRVVLICIVCVMLGAKIGSTIMVEKFNQKLLKKILGIVMLLVAIKFFYYAL